MSARTLLATAVVAAVPLLAAAEEVPAARPRTFATPEEAVHALIDTVKSGDLQRMVSLYGPHGQGLVDTSDPATGKRNRQVFLAAAREGWRLTDAGSGRKELVLGNEAWPFPVPLVRRANAWS